MSNELDCPAAPPHWPDARIFGIASGSPAKPEVYYLHRPLPVTPELLAEAAPATPREIFRIAATCAKDGCRHWRDGNEGAEGDGRCTLADRVIAAFWPDRVVELTDAAIATAMPGAGSLSPFDIPLSPHAPVPPCKIRKSCRWWAQEGPRACHPCARTVTDIGELPQDAESEDRVNFF